MIRMSVCVAAYKTKSALKFRESNVATKVSNYKTSLWKVFLLFLWFLHMLLFFRFDSYLAWFCLISHRCRGSSRRRRRSCCPSPHPPVQWNIQNIWNIQIIHLIKLPNEIFRIFKILKYEKNILENNIVSPVCGRCTGSCWRTACVELIRWSGRWDLRRS